MNNRLVSLKNKATMNQHITAIAADTKPEESRGIFVERGVAE